jgi:hypothetical protein
MLGMDTDPVLMAGSGSTGMPARSAISVTAASVPRQGINAAIRARSALYPLSCSITLPANCTRPATIGPLAGMILDANSPAITNGVPWSLTA